MTYFFLKQNELLMWTDWVVELNQVCAVCAVTTFAVCWRNKAALFSLDFWQSTSENRSFLHLARYHLCEDISWILATFLGRGKQKRPTAIVRRHYQHLHEHQALLVWSTRSALIKHRFCVGRQAASGAAHFRECFKGQFSPHAAE